MPAQKLNAYWCACLFVLVLPILRLRAAPVDIAEPIFKDQPGILREKEGQVKFQPFQQPEVFAFPPQPLTNGDALETLDFARASVSLSDKSGVRMKPSTRLFIIERA